MKSPTTKPPLAKPWWLLPSGRVHPAWWIALGAVIQYVDYLAGPDTPFPVAHIIPVTLAAWYSNLATALLLAVAMPAVHILLMVTVWKSAVLSTAVFATAVRALVTPILALWFARLAQHERALQQRVETLEGLLPICSFCKKIRNSAGEWEHLEPYISKRTDAAFTHSFCPTCVKIHYPETIDPNKDSGTKSAHRSRERARPHASEE